jgi:hypothetical protein
MKNYNYYTSGYFNLFLTGSLMVILHKIMKLWLN